MTHHLQMLPVLLLFLVGCGGQTPVARTPEPEDAGRILALARDFEEGRKTKQAIAAYRQVIQYFPETSEAKDAARRIKETQGAAIRNQSGKRSK
jgi:outer membrane protein assembly factor BamD (BamD/ComL family)